MLNGIIGVKEYDVVALYANSQIQLEERLFDLGEFDYNNHNITIQLCKDKPNYINKDKGVLYFDYDKIPLGAVLRVRQEGDVFTKFGGGTKNLGDYMTDKKIPLLERESLPIIAVNETVLIVCGVEISDLVKIEASTKKIAKITLK